MRKIETRLTSSIRAWKGFKLSNTEFRLSKINDNYGAVLLFNNIIAVVERRYDMYGYMQLNRVIMAQNAGWPTRTTHSRLRALGIDALPIPPGVGNFLYEARHGLMNTQGRDLDFFTHPNTHEHIILSHHFGE
jgi:hypothetical protein